ncbi:MAG TPA: AsmA family protein, partial [Candidatus Polarisedimenticolia bacterium]|nr:AsmA family protein [Candidatus Polarisedimenticolia bacterium]
MSRRLRRVLWIGGGLFAGLILLALVIPLFVDINRYHDSLELQAERLLGRDVTLGKMRLTLLPIPGVSVKPLTIASDVKGDPALLKAESLAAHARILPLLRGDIAVASLVAHHPELSLHRYPDGRWNLPELPAQGSAPVPPPSGAVTTRSGLSLSKLRIEGAKLQLVDEAVLPGRKVTTTLHGVDLGLDGYAPGRPFRVRLDAELPPKDSGRLS